MPLIAVCYIGHRAPRSRTCGDMPPAKIWHGLSVERKAGDKPDPQGVIYGHMCVYVTVEVFCAGLQLEEMNAVVLSSLVK